ncbi:rSAM-modified peptide [uncultured Kordia sp.]|uniref:rSAM-modified peptide n=1 Tax=uncultured Kordia sp. TaxID=507699 RepID=UPI00262FBAFE|nr:rSAM-modified peptide [uncultured Kordia sp.]
MKNRISQNLKLNKKSISKLQNTILGGAGGASSAPIDRSKVQSCIMSCANHSDHCDDGR